MTANDRKAEVVAAVQEWAAAYGYYQVDPRVIVAQSRHETGAWSSDLIQRANNAFGMMHPTRRATFSTGPTTNGYATYDSLADSVKDYFLRQRTFNVPNTSDDRTYMAATVASGYAEDPAYLDRWAANLASADWDFPAEPERPAVASFAWIGAALAALLWFGKKARRK